MSISTTPDRILDAAEALFAEHGYGGTSLRAVTGAAGVNLAAVHYHFDSKLGLFQAVFARRVAPLNAERIRLIDELEARGTDRPPTVEEILQAFLVPVLKYAGGTSSEGEARFMKLVGRVHSDSGEHVDRIKHVFAEVRDRFFPALARALPGVGADLIAWRMHFLIGSMCSLVADPQRVKLASDGLCHSDDPAEVLRHLVAYAAAGLRAPAPQPTPRNTEEIAR